MMTLYDFLRAGHIQRWHIVNTANTQTVAEHSYLVAMIAMHLCESLGGHRTQIHNTAILALFHDIAEVKTGDIPSPAKDLFREHDKEIKFMPDILERVELALMPITPFVEEDGDSLPHVCVKLADAIETAWWIKENGVGYHAQTVAVGCWLKLKRLVSHHGCLDQVNSILERVGMPCLDEE